MYLPSFSWTTPEELSYALNWWTYLHRPFGSFTNAITTVGTARSTGFVETSFLAGLTIFPFQPFILSSTLSITDFIATFLDLPILYRVKPQVIAPYRTTPKLQRIDPCRSAGVFEVNRMEDLTLIHPLTSRGLLVLVQYFLHLLTFLPRCLTEDQLMSHLRANSRCEIESEGPFLYILAHFNVPCMHASRP